MRHTEIARRQALHNNPVFLHTTLRTWYMMVLTSSLMEPWTLLRQLQHRPEIHYWEMRSGWRQKLEVEEAMSTRWSLVPTSTLMYGTRACIKPKLLHDKMCHLCYTPSLSPWRACVSLPIFSLMFYKGFLLLCRAGRLLVKCCCTQKKSRLQGVQSGPVWALHLPTHLLTSSEGKQEPWVQRMQHHEVLLIISC
jgi:hypothetical protein